LALVAVTMAMKTNRCPGRQYGFYHCLLGSTDRKKEEDKGLKDISGIVPDLEAKNSFLDFIAKYLESGINCGPMSLTHAVLTRMNQAVPKF
jgi:hypothetical protein